MSNHWKTVRSAATFLVLDMILLFSVVHVQTYAATTSENVTMILPFPTDNIGLVPLYDSQGLGFFTQEGIGLTTQFSQGTGDAVALLGAGKGDFALTSPDGLMTVVGKGANVLSVLTFCVGELNRLAVLDSSPYRQITDLKGKTIGIPFLGGLSYYILVRELKLAGMNNDSVKMVSVGLGQGSIENLFQQKIDAIVTPSYGTLQYLSQNRSIKVREIPLKSTPFPNLIVATTSTFLNAHRDTTIKVARAIAKGLVYFTANSSAADDVMARVHPELMSNRALVDFNSKYLSTVYITDEAKKHPIGWHDPEIWSEAQTTYQQFGIVTKGVDAQKCYTNDLLNDIDNFDMTAVENMAQPQAAQNQFELSGQMWLALAAIAIAVAITVVILRRARR